MAEIGDVIEKSIFLSPNQSLLAEYLSEANPKYVHTWSSADHTGTQSATEYYEQHGLGIIFRHREEANYVFATKPYAFLDDVCLLPKFGVFQNNFLIYKHLTNKLSQWSILAVEGSELLSKQIHAQMVYSNYEIGWRDEFRADRKRNTLFTGRYGNRGRSFFKFPENSQNTDIAPLLRATNFLNYSVGLLQSGVIYDEEVVLLPHARTWNGSGAAALQNKCVFFDKNIGTNIRIDYISELTHAVGEVLRTFGFRGVYGVDYLYDVGSERVYLCEVNPRYTGEFRLFGLPNNSNSSFRNPTNVHTLHIRSYLEDVPPSTLERPVADFLQIGGSDFRFSCSKDATCFPLTALEIDGSGYRDIAPSILESTHTNEYMVSLLQ
jgi:hypothetical protein